MGDSHLRTSSVVAISLITTDRPAIPEPRGNITHSDPNRLRRNRLPSPIPTDLPPLATIYELIIMSFELLLAANWESLENATILVDFRPISEP